MKTVNTPEELQQEWEDNLGYGLYLLVEDYRMQSYIVTDSDNVDEEDFTLVGLSTLLYEEEAGMVSIKDMNYPVEILFSDRMRGE